MDFGYCREREVVFYVGGEMVVGREEKRKTMKEQRKTMTIKKIRYFEGQYKNQRLLFLKSSPRFKKKHS